MVKISRIIKLTPDGFCVSINYFDDTLVPCWQEDSLHSRVTMMNLALNTTDFIIRWWCNFIL